MENNYQLSRIHNYIHGLMSREEMHALEREALEDPFLQDAIDGYRMQQGVDAKQLSLLQQRLAARVDSLAGERSKRFYSWQRLAVGMAAGVMFLIVCILILMRYLPNQNTADLTEVEIMPVKEYVVQVIPSAGDAQPVQGWQHLEGRIAKGLENNTVEEGEKHVRLLFDEKGKLTVSNVRNGLLNQIFEEEEWEGKEAVFSLKVNAKK